MILLYDHKYDLNIWLYLNVMLHVLLVGVGYFIL